MLRNEQQPRDLIQREAMKKIAHAKKQHTTQPNITHSSAVKGWKDNCDLQILAYNYNPKHPDTSEKARVTDCVASC